MKQLLKKYGVHRLQKYFTIVLNAAVVLSILSIAAPPASAIVEIVAPDVVEFGEIEVQAKFSPPLRKGETAVYSINNIEAMWINVLDGDITSFKSSFTLGASANILITRKTDNKKAENYAKYIRLTGSGMQNGEATTLDDSAKREIKSNGSYKAIFTSKNGFKNILVLEDSGFKAEIRGTNIVRRNPTFYVNGSFSEKIASSVRDFGGADGSTVQVTQGDSARASSETIQKAGSNSGFGTVVGAILGGVAEYHQGQGNYAKAAEANLVGGLISGDASQVNKSRENLSAGAAADRTSQAGRQTEAKAQTQQAATARAASANNYNNASANDCIKIDWGNSGEFAKFINNCGYGVTYIFCVINPANDSWSSAFDCGRQQFGTGMITAHGSSAAQIKGGTAVAGFACKSPAAPVDQRYIGNTSISANCR